MISLVQALLSGGETSVSGQCDQGVIRLEIPEAKLWSPEQPDLYRLELSLVEGGQVVTVTVNPLPAFLCDLDCTRNPDSAGATVK